MGNLGAWPEAGSATGLAAGDAICQVLAANAGLHAPESFVAWLSDVSEDARDRITGNGPWVRLDGVVIAQDKSELTNTGLIQSTIHVTETHQYESARVFTGSSYLGYVTSDHCINWTSGTIHEASYGDSGHSHVAWSHAGSQACSEQSRLYCFSNSAVWPLFSDQFESGDLRWWSAVVGD